MNLTDRQILLLKGSQRNFIDEMSDAILMEAGYKQGEPNAFTGYSLRELADFCAWRSLQPAWSIQESKLAFFKCVLSTSDFADILTNVRTESSISRL